MNNINEQLELLDKLGFCKEKDNVVVPKIKKCVKSHPETETPNRRSLRLQKL